MAWQTDIEERGLRRADIARREGFTRARVTQVMKLLDLPDDVRKRLLDGDEEVAGMTVRDAIGIAVGG